jgi:hypothetical protein
VWLHVEDAYCLICRRILRIECLLALVQSSSTRHKHAYKILLSNIRHLHCFVQRCTCRPSPFLLKILPFYCLAPGWQTKELLACRHGSLICFELEHCFVFLSSELFSRLSFYRSRILFLHVGVVSRIEFTRS